MNRKADSFSSGQMGVYVNENSSKNFPFTYLL